MSKQQAVEAIAAGAATQDNSATPPPMPTNPDIETVELDNPIVRGDMSICDVNINKPKTGAIRGLSIYEVLKLDVDTVIKLVPRVSTPPRADHEVAALDPTDFLSLSTAVVGFFASKDQREKARKEAESAKFAASHTV